MLRLMVTELSNHSGVPYSAASSTFATLRRLSWSVQMRHLLWRGCFAAPSIQFVWMDKA
jgi:hypothetical protein